MLFSEFKQKLRNNLEICRTEEIETIFHFVPQGYLNTWFSNLLQQPVISKKNIIIIPATEMDRIMSLINNAEDVCVIRTPEITPDIPNHYEIHLDFIEYFDINFGFSAYIPKPYIDVRNALIGVINKINIQECIKVLIQFESSHSKYNIHQILLANNEDVDVLYKQYIAAKISFLRNGQYVDGFAFHINNNQAMIDVFYEHMVGFLSFRDSMMLKRVCNNNSTYCKNTDRKLNPIESIRNSLKTKCIVS